PVALIVMHGMGQQIEFQTLDQVAQGLARAETIATGRALEPEANVVMIGDQIVRRVEIKGVGDEEREVHVYEAWWAPFTEGRVGLKDVTSFLWRAGIRGGFARRWERWIFGGMVPFNVPNLSRFGIVVTLATLAAMFVINATMAPAFLTRFLRDESVRPLAADLTVAATPPLAAAVLFVLLYFIAEWVRGLEGRRSAPPGALAIPSILTNAMRIAFLVLVVAIIAGAGLIVWFAWRHFTGDPRALYPFFERPWVMGLIWAAVLGSSWKARRFLIEYVGDVAAYVYPYHLDRFHEIRARIKDETNRIARLVYGAADSDGSLLYDRVGLVGHSLGSVIAYDTLNRVLLEDNLRKGALDALGRTRFLLTFASPLDKTAFLFRNQSRETTAVREALAATAQPLIRDAAFRPPHFEWINVYAPGHNDIIGDELDFYDAPGAPPPPRVVNVPDPDANVPLAAHVHHWSNPTVWMRLRSAI
ncbi:MAG TPA: hypothetical protein VMS56_04125, partial [Thermoanaerobaculia bacterium]|nr:hypothetical protein [Thermoanaerobaculia bacterium]